jgi:hypothetical protein
VSESKTRSEGGSGETRACCWVMHTLRGTFSDFNKNIGSIHFQLTNHSELRGSDTEARAFVSLGREKKDCARTKDSPIGLMRYRQKKEKKDYYYYDRPTGFSMRCITGTSIGDICVLPNPIHNKNISIRCHKDRFSTTYCMVRWYIVA